ncbi:hypothetical protein HDV00_008916 [Rhizophlyctis rosea]|nr:hypothetical protein HDV00_008916 [Rhizophlyctis rosea]
MRFSIPLLLPWLLHVAALLIGLFILLNANFPHGSNATVSQWLDQLPDASKLRLIRISESSTTGESDTELWYWDRSCSSGDNCVKWEDEPKPDGSSGEPIMDHIKGEVLRYTAVWLLPLVTATHAALVLILFLLVWGAWRKASWILFGLITAVNVITVIAELAIFGGGVMVGITDYNTRLANDPRNVTDQQYHAHFELGYWLICGMGGATLVTTCLAPMFRHTYIICGEERRQARVSNFPYEQV